MARSISLAASAVGPLPVPPRECTNHCEARDTGTVGYSDSVVRTKRGVWGQGGITGKYSTKNSLQHEGRGLEGCKQGQVHAASQALETARWYPCASVCA